MFRFTETLSDQFPKTQYWYTERVRTLWHPIPFTDGDDDD